MKEIKCPNCSKIFTIDETQYQDIVSQIRKEEFDQEITKQLEIREKAIKNEMELNIQESKNRHDKELAAKEQMIVQLSTKLDQSEVISKQNIEDALNKKEIEKSKEMSSLNEKIISLNGELEKQKELTEYTIKQSLSEVEKDRDQLKNELVIKEKDIENLEHSLRREFEVERKILNDQVETYKNFKAQQSTKMIGESLEQFALNEFNKIRSYAFPNAYFEKDNEVIDGEKGDFVYREEDENGVEILSIMFEMKNEADETVSKHKNADFYKKLDSDRRKKKCEYAVLVTMLEPNNEAFNTGIVDVSYLYDKMYVIRPQLFVQIIGILRNAALSSLKYRQELKTIKERDIDITNFEKEISLFKENFLTTAKIFNGNLAKLDKNLEESINKLTVARDELRKAMNKLGTAEGKINELSIKKLTKNSPTLKERVSEQSSK